MLMRILLWWRERERERERETETERERERNCDNSADNFFPLKLITALNI
jgi:hypothetical protein